MKILKIHLSFLLLLIFASPGHAVTSAKIQQPMNRGDGVSRCDDFIRTPLPVARVIALDMLARPRPVTAAGRREDLVQYLRIIFPDHFQVRDESRGVSVQVKTRKRATQANPFFFEMTMTPEGGLTKSVKLRREYPYLGPTHLSVTADENSYTLSLGPETGRLYRPPNPADAPSVQVLTLKFTRSGYLKLMTIHTLYPDRHRPVYVDVEYLFPASPAP